MDQKKELDVIFGVHPVLEKLADSPGDVLEVLVVPTLRGPTFQKLEEAVRRCGHTLGQTDTATLNGLTNHARHQGVAAKIAPFKYASFQAMLASLKNAGPRCVAFLDGLNDPRNFGSILRTSEAMGISDLVIPKDRAVGVTPTVIKTSAGAAHYVRIHRVSNLARSIVAVRDEGLWVIGLDPRAEQALHATALPARLAIVLGAEGPGIRPLVRSKCDDLVCLPMQGKVASMNVGVAWGMFAYELMRQRTVNEQQFLPCVDISEDR